mgnify:CR=1 FL=1
MKKILVLEDEASIRGFIVINLRRAGYDVIEAETGEEALERLRANPDTKVALLDIMLPGIDGFEVCRRIRATNTKIGIIMLIGLVAKNGILIVEFANQKQEAGEDKMSAIKDAALQRLRPILMTSASTVLGLIPLAFASGEGANQRIAMGTAVVGGMVVSTLLTMYIVPAIYSYISTNRIKITKE